MSQKKDPYEQVHVRWKESTYLEGYSGGLYFPPHAPGTPSLSEPCDRLMAEQLVDAEWEHYCIHEDEPLPAAEEETQQDAQHDAQASVQAAERAREQDEQAAAVQHMRELDERRKGEERQAALRDADERRKAQAQREADEQAAASGAEAGDEDDDGDSAEDDEPAPAVSVTYAPDLRRPVTREDALTVLGLSTSAPVSKAQIIEAHAVAQALRPAAHYPDHYAQITDAYNLLVLPQPPVALPPPPPAPAAAPPPPGRRPRRTPPSE